MCFFVVVAVRRFYIFSFSPRVCDPFHRIPPAPDLGWILNNCDVSIQWIEMEILVACFMAWRMWNHRIVREALHANSPRHEQQHQGLYSIPPPASEFLTIQ